MTDEKSYTQASSADDELVFLRLCYETDKTRGCVHPLLIQFCLCDEWSGYHTTKWLLLHEANVTAYFQIPLLPTFHDLALKLRIDSKIIHVDIQFRQWLLGYCVNTLREIVSNNGNCT